MENERLSAALLVQRQPEGTFAITQYGRLMLQLSSSFEFVFKHKEYFLTHDIWRLPTQFVNRIGELSQTNLIMDTIESLNKGERMFIEAEQYGWGLAEGNVPELMGAVMNERILKGVKLRFLIPESRLTANMSSHETAQNIGVRGLSEIPAIIALTEKEAVICFPLVGGRIDYAGFYGKDKTFHNWVKDLFLYYWDKGKRP